MSNDYIIIHYDEVPNGMADSQIALLVRQHKVALNIKRQAARLDKQWVGIAACNMGSDGASGQKVSSGFKLDGWSIWFKILLALMAAVSLAFYIGWSSV